MLHHCIIFKAKIKAQPIYTHQLKSHQGRTRFVEVWKVLLNERKRTIADRTEKFAQICNRGTPPLCPWSVRLFGDPSTQVSTWMGKTAGRSFILCWLSSNIYHINLLCILEEPGRDGRQLTCMQVAYTDTCLHHMVPLTIRFTLINSIIRKQLLASHVLQSFTLKCHLNNVCYLTNADNKIIIIIIHILSKGPTIILFHTWLIFLP